MELDKCNGLDLSRIQGLGRRVFDKIFKIGTNLRRQREVRDYDMEMDSFADGGGVVATAPRVSTVRRFCNPIYEFLMTQSRCKYIVIVCAVVGWVGFVISVYLIWINMEKWGGELQILPDMD